MGYRDKNLSLVSKPGSSIARNSAAPAEFLDVLLKKGLSTEWKQLSQPLAGTSARESRALGQPLASWLRGWRKRRLHLGLFGCFAILSPHMPLPKTFYVLSKYLSPPGKLSRRGCSVPSLTAAAGAQCPASLTHPRQLDRLGRETQGLSLPWLFS